jgi:hypothetical protein
MKRKKYVVVKSALKPTFFYIVDQNSGIGETLKCITGQTWSHTDRATADRVCQETNADFAKYYAREDEITRATFKRYFGRDVGQGAWPEQHDRRQEECIRVLVRAWRKTLGEDETAEYGEALDAARAIPGYFMERGYVEDIRIAYNAEVSAKEKSHELGR